MNDGLINFGAALALVFCVYQIPRQIFGYGSRKIGRGDYNGAIQVFSWFISLNCLGNAWLVWALLNRAVAYIGLNDFENAMSDCGSALKLSPVHAESLALKGICIWKSTHNFSEAMSALNSAIKAKPKSIFVLSQMATVLNEGGKTIEALHSWDRCVQLAPKKPENYANRALVHYKLRDYASALADCNQALKLKPAFAFGLAVRGMVWGRNNDLEAAKHDLNESLRLSPDFDFALAALGMVLIGNHEHAEAIPYLSKAIVLKPSESSYLLSRAAAYSGLYDHARALADCNAAIDLCLNDGQSYSMRGLVRARAYDADGALADCAEGLKLAPELTTVIAMMGAALETANRNQEALGFIDRALTLDSKSDRYLVWKAVCLIKLNRESEAIANCDQALFFNARSWTAHLNRAWANLRLGNLQMCAFDLEAAAMLQPDEPEVVAGQARSLIAQDMSVHAVKNLLAFVSAHENSAINPNKNPTFLSTQGIAFKSTGEFEKSLQLFDRAREIYPHCLEALWHHGDALEQLGKSEAAAIEKEQALASGYTDKP